MYDRALDYKHNQESRVNRILAEQFYHTVSNKDDLSLIKQLIAENITSEIQPAVIFAVLDNQQNTVFFYSKHDLEDDILNKLLPIIKETPDLSEGQIDKNDLIFSWFISDLQGYTNKRYSLLIIYPLSSFVLSEYVQFFGFPFFISGLLLCWVMVWASIIVSSLVVRLEKQKEILSDQAQDIEKSRDQALSANTAKSDFLANMSHEIRTPLTSIIGFAETCLEANQSMEERSKAIKIIIKSGRYLLHIINEILDLSKIESGKLEVELIPHPLMTILDEVNQIVSSMANDKALVFKINYNYPLPEKIISDPLRVKQILINLCSNAIKFTESGHVYLNVSYKTESSTLMFEVIDTGIGISDTQKEKIFKPFIQADASTTRKFGGTGLGLTLSNELAGMLKGDISVESDINIGSKFTFKLKIEEPKNCTYIYEDESKYMFAKTEQLNTAQPLLHGKVLVAEDHLDLQDLVKHLLNKLGVKLDIVGNGLLAIKAIEENDYDLVILDIQMPVMDGLTAMKTLKEKKYKKPVVAMTANAMKKDRDECKAAGFTDFVSKPINRNELYSVLAKYLKSNKTNESNITMLTSNLLTDEPDLIDLIDKFMTRLPEMRDSINQAHTEQDMQEFSSLIHQMKGVGGGYGYPMLTEICAKIEFQVASQDVENTKALIEEFNFMVDQIMEGSKENHKIAAQAQT